MRNLSMLVFVFTSVFASLAMAGESKIVINSPVNGAKLDSEEQNKLDYNVTLAGEGDHIHVYVDGNQKALLREMKGSYKLESLAHGSHEICIKIVNKNHTPTGVNRCVKVSVQ